MIQVFETVFAIALIAALFAFPIGLAYCIGFHKGAQKKAEAEAEAEERESEEGI